MQSIRLYTAGKNPVLIRAFDRLRKHLDNRNAARFTFEIIDVLSDPQAANRDRIYATPTIIKMFPPAARMVGDIQDAALVARTLGLV